MTKQKIVPNLWFDTEGEQAAKLYTSLFKNSRIGDTVPIPRPARMSIGSNPGNP
jgi:predicted 3-demethylubiquinone-9 3-methyltransferase (glyoxalase superfamily)